MSGSTFTVGSQAELNAAIETLDGETIEGNYTIALSGDIAEGEAGQPDGLYVITLQTGVTLTIDGNAHAIEGDGVAGGLAVTTGHVSVSNLTLQNTVAQGEAGGTGGGGGAGLGGGLFVGPDAVVSITDVTFADDAAKGGGGGIPGISGDKGGDANLIYPAVGGGGTAGTIGAAGASTGDVGATGGDGHQGGIGVAGGDGGDGGKGGGLGPATSRNGQDGGDGGDGGKGGAGGLGAPGGNGGDGGDGTTGGYGFSPGTPGGDAGDGGDGGDGADGDYGGGGGGGGDGGNGSSGTQGANGVQTPTSATDGADGSDGGSGGKGGDGGGSAFGGGGGPGGHGGDGGHGGLRGNAGGTKAPAGANGNGGPGGSGGKGGDGDFGAGGGGGGGGGNGGKGGGGLPGTTVATGGDGGGGAGGQGGLGGFGSGKGAAGQSGVAGASNSGTQGATRALGGAGGGGLGAGGAIFVADGGQLTVDGGLLSGDSVSGGGSGGAGAGSGSAYGSGIFIQSDNTLTLAASVLHGLTIADVIADQKGSGGTGSGAMEVVGPGTVDLAATNTFTGGILIAGGALELGAPGAAGTGNISFDAPADSSLDFDAADAPRNAVTEFKTGDTITVLDETISGLLYSPGDLSADFTGGGSIELNIVGSYVESKFHAEGNSVVYAPCYAAGTRLLTNRGEIPVEALRAGNRLVALFGGIVEVVWLGHRRVDCRGHPRPQDVSPVRVAADAFGVGLPRRDLWLSPNHAVYVDGALVPIRHLVNGATIVQPNTDVVTYWHVQLPAHDVIFAEGLPAESYLDTGNRANFANGGPAVSMHTTFTDNISRGKACAPQLRRGEALTALQYHLAIRAAKSGGVQRERSQAG